MSYDLVLRTNERLGSVTSDRMEGDNLAILLWAINNQRGSRTWALEFAPLGEAVRAILMEEG